MSLKILDSQIDLLSVYLYTKSSTTFSNRFSYMNRDVLKTINVIEVKEFDRVEKKIKDTYYKITLSSSSYPQYGKYLSNLSKGSKKQRRYKHTYITTLELLELKMTSKFRLRTGADRKWQPNPPKSQLQSVGKDERNRMKSQVESVMPKATKKAKREEYSKRLANRRKKGLYLDVGDYNAKKLGLNGDFWFRQSYILAKFGALYGKYFYEKSDPSVKFVFFLKHQLRAIEVLLKTGKIKPN